MATMQQSCLEVKGIEERNTEIVRNDYNKNDEYSVLHQDALATGDPQGKGTGNGGHTYSIPDCTLPKTLFRPQIDTTTNAGGSYDINGRNGVGGRVFNQNINKYTPSSQYSIDIKIDTSLNQQDGQYVVK